MRYVPVFLALTALLLAQAGHAADAGRLASKEIARSVLDDMDRTVDPCQDFYRYACGGWLDRNEIPPDKPKWGRSFDVLLERNQEAVRKILEEAARNPGSDPGTAKIGNYYAACMDEAAVDRAGIAPLKPMFDQIAAVKDAAAMMSVAGRLAPHGIPALFTILVIADFKDPDLAIAHFFQGGMGMPDRDYYFREDERGKALLKEYEAHIGRVLGLLGEPEADAEKHARAILAFETGLARNAMKNTETRDLENIYHKIDLDGLKRLTPGLDWDRYLSGMGYPGLTEINVGMPDFFKEMSALVQETDLDTLRAYLRWKLIQGTASHLSKPFVDENFSFYGKKLYGMEENQPRWKRCVNSTDEMLGEILGRVFVARHFPGESKSIAVDMVNRIEAAFAANLPNLSWMDAATRERAVGKMKMIVNKIGYPDKWRDYSSLLIDPRDHFANITAARAFEFRRNGDKVGKAIDRKEWVTTATDVNAFYNPTANDMTFPAGILQPPFFHRDFPPAMNYGGIGLAFGHELTHGFDDSGRKFDGKGMMHEWWDPSVAARFEERARCFEERYGEFEVEPGLTLNGKLTLGENIADVGGVKQAYMAHKALLKEQGNPPLPVEGLTNDQLFFVAFGQVWCENWRPEFERLVVATDPHPLSRFRVNGVAMNLAAFSEAFQCEEGTPMNPKEKCEIW